LKNTRQIKRIKMQNRDRGTGDRPPPTPRSKQQTTQYAVQNNKKSGRKLKTPTHLLDYQGLVQVLELIERMRQEGRYPIGERETTCEPEEDGYDETQQAVEKTSEVKS
jgi:hypothetical protein